MVKVRYVFGTRSDVEPGLCRFETLHHVRYFLQDSFEAPALDRYISALDLPLLGQAPSGSHLLQPAYLVLNRDDEPVVREVEQRRGPVRYILDLVENPRGILFWPGGIYRECCLVRGEIQIASDDAPA